MPTSHSVLITASTVWDVPANVSCVRIEYMCGGGGGGGCGIAGVSGIPGGGGGAGDYIFSTPLPVTPGGTVTITIGSGGAGAVSDATASAGTDTTITTATSTFHAVGGWGGISNNTIGSDSLHHWHFAAAGGFGGGMTFGIPVNSPSCVGQMHHEVGLDGQANIGSAERFYGFGGSGGGSGAVGWSNQDGYDGGWCCGYPGGTKGLGQNHPPVNSFDGLGAGGGSASPFGVGPAGGAWNTDGLNAVSPGTGGGGGGGKIFGTNRVGGNGASGAVMLTWIA